MSITDELCRKIVAIEAEAIPVQAWELANQVVLDGIAVAVAGAAELPVRILADYFREQGGNPVASMVGCGYKGTLFQAAYVNAASMHVLDYEPMSNPSTHATSPVLPGVLALAEWREYDGRELALALIKGVEMQARLRIATGKPGQYRFHTPGVVGPMGGAIAAGHLLRLDAVQTGYALGIAASRCGSLMANAGSMAKCTHLGLAAANGLEAALLAARGFTASPDVMEHRWGYAQAFLDGEIEAESLLSFGNPYRIVEARYAIKLFPCVYPTHWGIDAALQLRDRISSVDQIKEVTLTALDTPPMRRQDRPQLNSGLEGKFSHQYTVACALVDGRVGIDHFTDECLSRPDIAAMLAKVRVAYDDNREADDEAYCVRLAVQTLSGEIFTSECKYPAGHFHLPVLSLERHRTKLHECLRRTFGPVEEEEIIALAGHFDQLKNKEVKRLMELVSRRAS